MKHQYKSFIIVGSFIKNGRLSNEVIDFIQKNDLYIVKYESRTYGNFEGDKKTSIDLTLQGSRENIDKFTSFNLLKYTKRKFCAGSNFSYAE